MKIFLSHSSKDRPKAEEIALTLQTQGNDVFFDKDDLSGGEDFHSMIREHVENADLFVFLISPESVRPGSYTLTELRLVREKWASPKKHVLPVMLEPTDSETIPPYLKGVTIFEPEGNVAAEVAAHVGRLSRYKEFAITDKNGELGREHGNRIRVSSASLRWLFLGFVVLSIFVFFSFFAPQFGATSLEIDLTGKKISINTNQVKISTEEAKGLSAEDYYVDSQRGFSFKKLPTTEWVSHTAKGIEELMTLKGLVLTQGMREGIEISMQTHPLGSMLREVETVRFTAGKPLNVEITDESTNQIIEEFFKNIQKSSKLMDIESDDEEVRNFKKKIIRESIGFDKLQFSNELMIGCYNKNLLSGVPIKCSLATFSLMYLANMGLAADQLSANSASVIAGTSTIINNAMINGKKQDFHVDRLCLITENKQHYTWLKLGFHHRRKALCRSGQN